MPPGATDFDIPTLRARRTNKWHKFPDDVLPAWVADMDFGVAPAITEALARLARNQEYGYAAREGALAAAFSRRMGRRFDWHTDPADKRAPKFIKGRLVRVDCSQAPAAVLTVASEGAVLKLRTPDYKSLLLIGADDFSCNWRDRAVTVNYKPGGVTDGDLVSLEVR